MCSHNEACFRYIEERFQYHCPTCGLAGPRAKRAREAKLGWIDIKDERVSRRRAETSRLEELNLHAASV